MSFDLRYFRSSLISWKFRFLSCRPSDFSILCYYDLKKFQKFILTLGHFVPMSFRTLDFSVFCQFDPRTFRPYFTNIMSTFDIIVLPSFRLIGILVLCHFHLWTFQSYVISTLRNFKKSFDPWIFRTNIISNFILFCFMSFRPADFSAPCYFEYFRIFH